MNVLIVDDHPLVCSGIRSILLSEQNMDSILQANDIQTAMRLMENNDFSLVLVDMRLKDESGVDLVHAAKAKYPGCKFVILSSSSTAVDFDRALHANVDGYILKDAFPEDIIYAVRTVLRGKKYFDPVFLEKINVAHQATPSGGPEELSPREEEILRCLGEAMSNKSIADKLFISENTVKKHVSSILTKLNLSDRTQAALYASRASEEEWVKIG